MKTKTIDEELPVTKEGLYIYIKGMEKALAPVESQRMMMRNRLKKAREIMEKINNYSINSSAKRKEG